MRGRARKARMKPLRTLLAVLLASLLAVAAGAEEAPESPPEAEPEPDQAATYDRDSVLQRAEEFFGKGAEGLARVVAKIFEDLGSPTGFITGEEAAGAFVVGARYGHGTLELKSGATSDVYWQGISVGFDAGGNAAKTFILVYNLEDVKDLFQRYPGVDGSLYFVGGLGVNYHRSENITLAPVRLGVGWRLGANVGYLKVRRSKTLVPF